MIIGVPREVKSSETRVALVPAGVRALVRDGHQVVVESGAGQMSGTEDADCREAGASLAAAAEVFRKDLILFTYLHLAPLPKLTQALVDSGVAAIAYETIEDAQGGLPLLTPMSQVAGRLSIQAGACHLQKSHGGSGVLLAGVPGSRRARSSSSAAAPSASTPRRSRSAWGTRPTTHAEPVFEVDGVIHYCVANMPAAVPRTSTCALTNATLPFVLGLARHGLEGALRADASLRKGANVLEGKITCRPVAESQGKASSTVESLL